MAAGSMGSTAGNSARSSTEPCRGAAPVVSASAAALEVIRHLEAAHGPLVFFLSGGCCDGTSPICLRRGELEPRSQDVQLGDLGDAPFYVDSEQYERWGKP